MKPAFLNSRIGPRKRERGVALVITLILLSVITFMAITFLVVSRSERTSVSTTTEQAIARLGADAALEQAKADLIMPIMAQDNPFLVAMMVSTNFINPDGFQSGNIAVTNVNYYYANGNPVTGNDFIQNVNNLLYRPRVPVYMRNRQTGQTTFQYYLDMNRNGQYEPNGWVTVTNNLNQPVLSNNIPVTMRVIGDPEWIGVLEFPERRHSGTNRFTSRFVYVIAPVGQTLDLNNMHNAGRFLSLNGGDGFVRNQGVGTWELNMGAFFTDLNTNMWFSPGAVENGWGSGYRYETDLSRYNAGAGFDDATALLRYRYDNNWANLWTPTALFSAVGLQAFRNDGFDTFGSGAGGTILDSPSGYSQDPEIVDNRANRQWPGGYNPNLFYSPTDLFDRTKTARGVTGRSLTDRLEEAAKRPSTYDRYTFQRLLEQLGTESPPEEDKINVNYQNVVNGRVVPNYQTNFLSWENNVVGFFTNAANRLLDNAGFTFTVTNIQIWPTNYYTPSVHRALQLAANLYDATSSNQYPTVFRPLFQRRDVNGTNAVFIAGYRRVVNINDLSGGVPVWRDLLNVSERNAIGPDDLVWGVPFVVGAKKGHPNFNEYAMDTKLQATRKLEFLRTGGNEGPISQTNQMVTFSLINGLGLEAWNSYLYSNRTDVRINARVEVFPSMTNRFGQLLYPAGTSTNVGLVLFTNFTVNQGRWRPYASATVTAGDGSLLPVLTNAAALLPASTFSENLNRFITPAIGRFEPNGNFPITDWFLNLRTRVYYSLVDNATDEIIDFVTLTGFSTTDLADILQRNDSRDTAACGIPYRPYQPSADAGAMWCTNRVGGSLSETIPTYGILNQIAVSMGLLQATQWPQRTNMAAINFFRAQFDLGALSGSGTYSKTNTFYAPYSPTREIYLMTKWQANDPLVHYTTGDLLDQGNPIAWDFKDEHSNLKNVGKLNARYEPWKVTSSSASPTTFELSIKDPLIRRSDDWDFPTNKFPNIGWIGRVHRGTPWQTVYLKSKVADTNQWVKWAGSGVTFTNMGQVKFTVVASNTLANDSIMSLPLQDWNVADIFTASLVDNATRGQLSINQTNLAAWSAVLAGVPVLSNLTVNGQGQFIAATNIQPAVVDGALQQIVDGINRTRSQRPGGVFRKLAEIASVPELTVSSPYIRNPGRVGDLRQDLVSDAVYERIPQQVLGLLRCEDTPRFVVYSYGQALKPANNSLLTSGNYSGMCTNYSVTAEVATRAVIRVDGAPANPQIVVENFNVLPPD